MGDEMETDTFDWAIETRKRTKVNSISRQFISKIFVTSSAMKLDLTL